MSYFTCSDYSQQIGEDIIGTATNYQTYILVECPPPWMSKTFNSKWVPDNLRVLVEDIQRSYLSVRFLLIANHESHQTPETTLLIYQQQNGLSNGYQKQEFKLPNIELAAVVIRKYLSGKDLDYELKDRPTRDILVCTHGSHDQCCARYGNPFQFYARKIIADLELDHVRIWKSTHFGGHRFAPTAIDFPQGRYYGCLNQNSFRSILTFSGDIECLNQVYRGWGILPPALQVFEKEFMLDYGWDWFNYQVSGKILEQSLDNETILANLSFAPRSDYFFTYQVKLVRDSIKSQVIKSSCNSTHELLIVKYAIEDFWLVAKETLACGNLV
jgi:hypothetical protein